MIIQVITMVMGSNIRVSIQSTMMSHMKLLSCYIISLKAPWIDSIETIWRGTSIKATWRMFCEIKGCKVVIRWINFDINHFEQYYWYFVRFRYPCRDLLPPFSTLHLLHAVWTLIIKYESHLIFNWYPSTDRQVVMNFWVIFCDR